MAIKISNLSKISKELEVKPFYFNDLHLDIEDNGGYSKVLEKYVAGNDIVMDYDESAIKNSLKNLFNTKPGQRFLFPEYGLDLNMYLFERVSADLGQLIGEKITNTVQKFEPRVKILQCIVIPVPEEYLYDITLTVQIPAFDTIASINSNLDIRSKSFIFVETSRNR